MLRGFAWGQNVRGNCNARDLELIYAVSSQSFAATTQREGRHSRQYACETRSERIVTYLPRLKFADIRTLYILFILSFLKSSSPSSVKSALLEEHREAFWSIFKGIQHDSYSVCRHIFEVCWSGLWADPKVRRTLKVACFSDVTLQHVRT